MLLPVKSNAVEIPQLLEEATRSNWAIDAKDVRFLRKIGTGGFGEVWIGKWKGTTAAIKKMHSMVSAESLREFCREASILACVSLFYQSHMLPETLIGSNLICDDDHDGAQHIETCTLSFSFSLSVSPSLTIPNGTERNGTHAQTQPHVISLYGAAVGTEDLMLVMEYAQNGISLSLSCLAIKMETEPIADRSNAHEYAWTHECPEIRQLV